jgi:hypothetical protein
MLALLRHRHLSERSFLLRRWGLPLGLLQRANGGVLVSAVAPRWMCHRKTPPRDARQAFGHCAYRHKYTRCLPPCRGRKVCAASRWWTAGTISAIVPCAVERCMDHRDNQRPIKGTGWAVGQLQNCRSGEPVRGLHRAPIPLTPWGRAFLQSARGWEPLSPWGRGWW